MDSCCLLNILLYSKSALNQVPCKWKLIHVKMWVECGIDKKMKKDRKLSSKVIIKSSMNIFSRSNFLCFVFGSIFRIHNMCLMCAWFASMLCFINVMRALLSCLDISCQPIFIWNEEHILLYLGSIGVNNVSFLTRRLLPIIYLEFRLLFW